MVTVLLLLILVLIVNGDNTMLAPPGQRRVGHAACLIRFDILVILVLLVLVSVFIVIGGRVTLHAPVTTRTHAPSEHRLEFKPWGLSPDTLPHATRGAAASDIVRKRLIIQIIVATARICSQVSSRHCEPAGIMNDGGSALTEAQFGMFHLASRRPRGRGALNIM